MPSENSIRYTIRLNPNNPEHQKINRILQGYDKRVYRSMNSFVIKAIEQFTERTPDDELLSEETFRKLNAGKFVEKSDLDSIKAEIKNEIMQEVISMLFSAITRSDGNKQTQIEEPMTKDSASKNDDYEEFDSTISSLAGSWAR